METLAISFTPLCQCLSEETPVGKVVVGPFYLVSMPGEVKDPIGPGRVIFFPINTPGMGRFQLLNLGGLGYGLELRFWVVISIIVSITLTITLITTLTII